MSTLAEKLLDTLPTTKSNPRLADTVEERRILVDERRRITVPPELQQIAVTGDKDVETVTFDCTRYWDGNDLSTFSIFLYYSLPDGVKGVFTPNTIYLSDDYYSFDWTIGSELTRQGGTLAISLVARQTDADGNVLKQWGSFPNGEMKIVAGLFNPGMPDGGGGGSSGSGTIIALENVPVELNLSSGDQKVSSESGYLMKSVLIKKPNTLIPENIRYGVNIAGIIGAYKGASGGGGGEPILAAPTISIDGSIVTIIPSAQGQYIPNFYRFYSSEKGVLLSDTSDLQFDLSTAQYNTTGDYEGEWKALPRGTYNIYARACIGTGQLPESDCVEIAIESENSNTVSYTKGEAVILDETINMTVGETKVHWANYDAPEDVQLETGSADYAVISNDGVVSIEVLYDDCFSITALKAGTAQFRITASNTDIDGKGYKSEYILTVVVTGGADSGDSYSVFGKYTLKQKLQNNAGVSEIRESVNFVDYSGTPMVGFDVSIIPTTSKMNLYYMAEGGELVSAYYDGWVTGQLQRAIDFGSEAQTVSKVFYDWFMANAVRTKELTVGIGQTINVVGKQGDDSPTSYKVTLGSSKLVVSCVAHFDDRGVDITGINPGSVNLQIDYTNFDNAADVYKYYTDIYSVVVPEGGDVNPPIHYEASNTATVEVGKVVNLSPAFDSSWDTTGAIHATVTEVDNDGIVSIGNFRFGLYFECTGLKPGTAIVKINGGVTQEDGTVHTCEITYTITVTGSTGGDDGGDEPTDVMNFDQQINITEGSGYEEMVYVDSGDWDTPTIDRIEVISNDGSVEVEDTTGSEYVRLSGISSGDPVVIKYHCSTYDNYASVDISYTVTYTIYVDSMIVE